MRSFLLTTGLLGLFITTCCAQTFLLREDSGSNYFGPYPLKDDGDLLNNYTLRATSDGRWRVTSFDNGIRDTLGTFAFTNNAHIRLKNRSFEVLTGAAIQEALERKAASVQRDAAEKTAKAQQYETEQLSKGLVRFEQEWVTKAEYERLQEDRKPDARIGKTRRQWVLKYGDPIKENASSMHFEKNGFHIAAVLHRNVVIAAVYNLIGEDELGRHPPLHDFQIETLLSLNSGTNQWTKINSKMMEQSWETKSGTLKACYQETDRRLAIYDEISYNRYLDEKEAREKHEIDGL